MKKNNNNLFFFFINDTALWHLSFKPAIRQTDSTSKLMNKSGCVEGTGVLKISKKVREDREEGG